MMKLNHINLPVGDVAAARDFLTTSFGMKTAMELPGNKMAILRDDGEMVLILSHFDKQTTEVAYHSDFHVGFYVESRAAVDASYAGLTANGIEGDKPRPRQGRYSYYVNAPGGFIVEVAFVGAATWGPDQPAADQAALTTS